MGRLVCRRQYGILVRGMEVQGMEWLATAAFGLEGLVKKELISLGMRNVRADLGGARFTADAAGAFLCNLWLRTADRVLLVVREGEATTFDQLFELVKGAPWEDYLEKDAAFPVSGNCARSQLMSVRDCQAIAKKAIAERMREKYKQAWHPETGATYQVNVAVHKDIARVTLDASGDALSRRGYRTWNGEAPLRETLAAAMVALSPWKPGEPLHDPCCGTGTLLCEAALLAADRAPGLTRAFACERWGIFRDCGAAGMRADAKARARLDAVTGITGGDIDPEAIELARRHIAQAGMQGRILVKLEDLRDAPPLSPGTHVVCNPPYGERMGDKKACAALYRQMGAYFARQACASMTVIASDPAFEKQFGRRADRKRRLYNGRLECEVMTFNRK